MEGDRSGDWCEATEGHLAGGAEMTGGVRDISEVGHGGLGLLS